METLLSALECPEAELSVLITDDEEIAELNEHYRSKKGATDVLSFAMREAPSEGAEDILGDVVISLETAERQARSLEVSLGEELLRLLIHGTLHLLGYDHEDVPEEEAERMRDKEEELYLLLLENVVVAKAD